MTSESNNRRGLFLESSIDAHTPPYFGSGIRLPATPSRPMTNKYHQADHQRVTIIKVENFTSQLVRKTGWRISLPEPVEDGFPPANRSQIGDLHPSGSSLCRASHSSALWPRMESPRGEHRRSFTADGLLAGDLFY